MIASLATLATRIGSTLGAWIEAAYVLDCSVPEEDAGHGTVSEVLWLPALSGVTVASARAMQSHAVKVRKEP
ncbi:MULTISPECIES: hypothetical protein [Micrococcaceae]|jgi:hypothetical protein|uniref:Uncharacterized protein n=1 Tax=Paenarthrobacter aurescens (strain TC1) TaxID=290340 RepID=A1R3E8_PAEAT|nr:MULTISPECIES: hypothetical protein [Micrococcaceae]ABM07897.1 hypothetical protein AAur_0970 [Paenarthrobacter aurescens TC1]AFR27845.1 hypothetical protein ARUE_c09220 [Arthrobacter sp. Rue61a]MBP2267241.1 hypothetical protein [Pseudarthrobacter sp. PvP004]